jgi:hypothetical protein
MTLPTERQLLDVWERGVAASRTTRGTALVALADPAATPGLATGERERRLLLLRRALFGRSMSALATCPRCGERHDVEFDVDGLLTHGAASADDRITLRHDEMTLTLRPVTGEDLEAAANAGDVEAAMATLVSRCVVDARRGEEALPPCSVPRAAWTAVGDALGAADPLADLSAALDCAACGEHWTAALDTADYLWRELEGWAHRLLRDVAGLAAAYSWTEDDVLRLSPSRRAVYLSLGGR